MQTKLTTVVVALTFTGTSLLVYAAEDRERATEKHAHHEAEPVNLGTKPIVAAFTATGYSTHSLTAAMPFTRTP